MASKVSLKTAFGWSPLPSGFYRRPLDGLESFFVMLNNSSLVNEHWAISMNLRLDLPRRLSAADAELCLKHTWLAVCHNYPALTGCIELETTHQALVVIPLITRGDDSSWLSRTFFTQHKNPHGSLGSDSASPDHYPFTGLRNTKVPTCHWLPASQELHIRCQHWRIDGIGMLMLADTFMSALASVTHSKTRAGIGKSTSNMEIGGIALSPCLYDLVNLNLDEATTPLPYLDAADSLVASYVKGIPSIGLPAKPGSEDTVPGDTTREIVVLSVAQTEEVIAACKPRMLNVAGAVHAALVRVMASYPQHPLAKSYACFFLVDMRRHLPNPPGDGKLVVNMFSSGLPVCISDVLSDGDGVSGKSFADIAAEISAVYASDLARPRKVHTDSDVSMLKLVPPYMRRTTKLFGTPPPPQFPPLQSPDLSSLGKIADYLKPICSFGSDGKNKLEVTEFWMGTQMMNRQLQCHVWTFRDQLSIQGCFNTSFYERNFIKNVLEKVQMELLNGLGVM